MKRCAGERADRFPEIVHREDRIAYRLLKRGIDRVDQVADRHVRAYGHLREAVVKRLDHGVTLEQLGRDEGCGGAERFDRLGRVPELFGGLHDVAERGHDLLFEDLSGAVRVVAEIFHVFRRVANRGSGVSADCEHHVG